ncbi:MAG: energy transducer TonB [Acetobacteraceae bacterium]|nr:energy transducer TonB [Acetobacteraceae bacterium]
MPDLPALPTRDIGGRWPAPRHTSRIGPAAIASIAAHLLLAALFVVGSLRYRAPQEAPVTPATVELVMAPPGSTTNGAPVADEAAKPAPAEEAKQEPKPAPAQEAKQEQTPTSRPQPEPPSQTTPARPQPQPPAIDLGSIESDTNAWVRGDIVVPPRPDIKFHNIKPSYPREAALRREHGEVIVVIHVTPEGLVSHVDIAQSSGFTLLDRAAREAIQTWHFMPAVKDGEAVSFEVPMRIVFALY